MEEVATGVMVRRAVACVRRKDGFDSICRGECRGLSVSSRVHIKTDTTSAKARDGLFQGDRTANKCESNEGLR